MIGEPVLDRWLGDNLGSYYLPSDRVETCSQCVRKEPQYIVRNCRTSHASLTSISFKLVCGSININISIIFAIPRAKRTD